MSEVLSDGFLFDVSVELHELLHVGVGVEGESFVDLDVGKVSLVEFR